MGRIGRLRPPALTYTGQLANIGGVVLVFLILARQLPEVGFGRYAGVMAGVAIANSIVGVAIGTRAVADLAAQRAAVVTLSRANIATLGCVGLALAALSLLIGCSASESAVAVLGFISATATEFANSLALGHRRLHAYATLAISRSLVWAAASGLAVTTLSAPHRLIGGLVAYAISGSPGFVYLAACRGTRLDRAARSPLSGAHLGLTQLGLWITASADRVILAHINPVAAASYAAIYSPMDRVYRTVASSEAALEIPSRVKGTASNRLRPYAIRGLLLFCMAIAAGSVGPRVVNVATGGRYLPSHLLVSLLAAGMTLMVAAVPLYAEVVAHGRREVLVVASLAAAVLNLALNFTLIPRYGTTAAAISTLAAYALWFGVLGVALRSRVARQTVPAPSYAEL